MGLDIERLLILKIYPGLSCTSQNCFPNIFDGIRFLIFLDLLRIFPSEVNIGEYWYFRNSVVFENSVAALHQSFEIYMYTPQAQRLSWCWESLSEVLWGYMENVHNYV